MPETRWRFGNPRSRELSAWKPVSKEFEQSLRCPGLIVRELPIVGFSGRGFPDISYPSVPHLPGCL